MTEPGGAPQRVGLIGYPLGHSLSPVFQQAAFDACGIDARYELWPTPAEGVAAVVAGLRRPDALGCNVTVPHKELVVGLADERSAAVARVGAANTLVRLADGRLRADNTDLYGFRRALDEAGVAVRGATVVVLGAGGAARAVLVALAEAGVARLLVANRRPERAARLLAELDLAVLGEVAPLDGPALRDWLPGAALIVNATAVGWHGDETPLDPDWLPSGAAVYDLTYRDTALLRAARARGLAAHDGLTMLVYQGARSFELWTDQPAPVGVMLAAAEAGLAARARSGAG
jgi:shikimate dehydrogenase